MGAKKRIRLIAGSILLLLGCKQQTNRGATTKKTETRYVELTVLYTADEHGWIEPVAKGPTEHGGASNFFTKLRNDEGHCIASRASEESAFPNRDCRQSNTLLLSGGDNYTGPVISTFFGGHSMAQVMRQLGYVASAFGNHEFDFGQEQFLKNRKASGIRYLAANLVGASSHSRFAQASLTVERRGIRLGIIGIATPETLKTAAPHRFRGLRFLGIEATLNKEVPALWAKQVDAVLVVAHECGSVLEPIVRRHPEWSLSFVGAGHCHKKGIRTVNDTPIVSPDWRMQHYGRIRIRFDRNKAPRQRAKVVAATLQPVALPMGSAQKSSAPWLGQQLPRWKASIQKELGRVVGFSAKGLDKDSVAIGQWIVGAWKSELQVDAALTTRGAIRQNLPIGSITLGTIRSIMPFENELFVCRLRGKKLLELRNGKDAIFVGPKVIDPARSYRLVTTDFLYHGGDGYKLKDEDPTPTETGLSWRQPLIAWTQKMASGPSKPIEQLLSTNAASPSAN